LVEKSKCEALEKKLVEMEEQLYSVNIENDAVKEKFMAIVADRDEMIKKLEVFFLILFVEKRERES